MIENVISAGFNFVLIMTKNVHQKYFVKNVTKQNIYNLQNRCLSDSINSHDNTY